MYFDSTQCNTSTLTHMKSHDRLVASKSNQPSIYVFTFYYLLSYCSNPYMFIFWLNKTRDGTLSCIMYLHLHTHYIMYQQHLSFAPPNFFTWICRSEGPIKGKSALSNDSKWYKQQEDSANIPKMNFSLNGSERHCTWGKCVEIEHSWRSDDEANQLKFTMSHTTDGPTIQEYTCSSDKSKIIHVGILEIESNMKCWRCRCWIIVTRFGVEAAIHDPGSAYRIEGQDRRGSSSQTTVGRRTSSTVVERGSSTN